LYFVTKKYRFFLVRWVGLGGVGLGRFLAKIWKKRSCHEWKNPLVHYQFIEILKWVSKAFIDSAFQSGIRAAGRSKMALLAGRNFDTKHVIILGPDATGSFPSKNSEKQFRSFSPKNSDFFFIFGRFFCISIFVFLSPNLLLFYSPFLL